MRYKALMLDHDGTLAPAKRVVQIPSDKVIESIQQAKKKLVVCLVTARPLVSIKPVLLKLELKSYSILLNGAQIIQSQNFKTIWSQAISLPAVKQIYEIGQRNKFAVYSSNFKDDFKVKTLKQLTNQSIADIYFDEIPQTKIAGVEAQLSHISTISLHRIITSKPGHVGLDITDIHATKAHAIAHVAKLLKIKPKQMIGVGDGPNDFPLLMACGLKIAMGNAVDELKAIADFVAPSVDEDGMTTIIEKFILEENS